MRHGLGVLNESQHSLKGKKIIVTQYPVLLIRDQDRQFHLLCDANDFAIDYALMKYDTNGA